MGSPADRRLQELHIELIHVREDAIETERRSRLQKGVLLAWVAHVAKEWLVQSRCMKLDEPGIVTGELKRVRRAGGNMQKIARPRGSCACVWAGGPWNRFASGFGGLGVASLDVKPLFERPNERFDVFRQSYYGTPFERDEFSAPNTTGFSACIASSSTGRRQPQASVSVDPLR